MYSRYNQSPGQSTQNCGGGSQLLSGLFPVQIGWDVSGVFVMSLYGLAVMRPDGRAVVHRKGELLDVTLFLLPQLSTSLPGAGVLRTPVQEVETGELIVTSDNPLSLLYVLERKEDALRGLDPFTGQIVHYSPPLSPFLNYSVRVQSLFSRFFSEKEGPKVPEGAEQYYWRDRHNSSLRSLLPLLLLCSQGQTASSSLMTFLVIQALEGRLGREQ